MGDINSKLAAEAQGIENPIDFAGAASPSARVQLLIDAISKEATDPDDHRLFLDEMSPACRTSLYVILTAMKGDIIAADQVVITDGVEFASPAAGGAYVDGYTPTIANGVVTALTGS